MLLLDFANLCCNRVVLFLFKARNIFIEQVVRDRGLVRGCGEETLAAIGRFNRAVVLARRAPRTNPVRLFPACTRVRVPRTLLYRRVFRCEYTTTNQT